MMSSAQHGAVASSSSRRAGRRRRRHRCRRYRRGRHWRRRRYLALQARDYQNDLRRSGVGGQAVPILPPIGTAQLRSDPELNPGRLIGQPVRAVELSQVDPTDLLPTGVPTLELHRRPGDLSISLQRLQFPGENHPPKHPFRLECGCSRWRELGRD